MNEREPGTGTERKRPVQADIVQPHHRPFQLVWVIPFVAAIIAGYLVWQTYSNRGPSIVVTFRSGDGLVSGQTKVRHKAVELGTVRRVGLSKDLERVEVGIDMQRTAEPILTESARFWVVRPRLTGSNISGLDTLLSGAYIEIDPGGTGDGGVKTKFTGLEDPPAVRSGEPGTPFTLRADRIGSLGSGSPVFWRDIVVGEVLTYEVAPPSSTNAVSIRIFVRAPFDKYVHQDTHFWNASGVSVELGADGVQLRLESLQAALSGGIAFETPRAARAEPASAPEANFRLFRNEGDADAAGYARSVKMVVYFDGSVRGLAPGAPVMLNGIQIGKVTDIKLLFDPRTATPSRVAVHMEVQPERFMPSDQVNLNDTLPISRALVEHGLRAQLSTANFLTGQMLVEFAFDPDAGPAEVPRFEGDEVVLPGTSGGLNGLTTNLSRLVQKLDHLPLDQVIRNVNEMLHGVSTLVNGPDLKQTLQSVALASKRLPQVAQSLETTANNANKLVDSAQAGYGTDSQFRRDLSRTLEQLSTTARSIRLLADYLTLHPEALIRGRTDRGAER